MYVTIHIESCEGAISDLILCLSPVSTRKRWLLLIVMRMMMTWVDLYTSNVNFMFTLGRHTLD